MTIAPLSIDVLYGSPYSDLHRWMAWESVGSTNGNVTVMEKGKWLATRTWILADQVHSCTAQVLISNSGFAHLQNQAGGTLTREFRSTSLDSHMRHFAGSTA